MKKIGIITFHRANNYGAIFQTYALKFVLQILGQNVDVINYSCKQVEKFYSFFNGKKTIKWFLKKFIETIFIHKRIISNNNFNKFRKKYLTDTPILNSNDINSIENKYDIFITGSDQVFNPQITNFDSNYLLSFVRDNNKKYSYAASIGFEKLNQKEGEFLKNGLNCFSKISVREKQAAKIISSLTNKQVLVHLDPTLFLNKQQWDKIAKYNERDDYILVYLMSNNNKIVSFAKKLAEIKNLKLINVSLNFINRTGIKTICPTPEELLGYFLNAKYIVTNSFHGLCFSINFNKQFFIDLLSNNWPVNSRIDSLLDLTNLRDRLIDNIETDYDKPINWDSINKIIEEEKEKSLDYLKSIVL